MSDYAVLIEEIQTLPPSCLGEVLDFVEFIKQKNLKKNQAGEKAEKDTEKMVREMWDSLPTIEECLQEAAEKTARRKASGVKPFEGLYGVFRESPTFAGDPVQMVSDWRDEWDVVR